jgi:hypothetical protein
MFPTIHDSRQSAAHCDTIEFIASARLLSAWLCWLAVVVAVVLLADLARGWQCLAILAIGLAARTVMRFVGLSGEDAVRAVGWNVDASVVQVRLGSGTWVRARPAGCRRYGPGLWLLGFDTPGGRRGLAVEAALQDPRAFRAFIRILEAVETPRA